MVAMLESEEAARRLGIKVATLYAYVSRGLLVSHPAPDGRRSLFDVEDVERLVRRTRDSRRVEGRLATVSTSLTQLREDGGPIVPRPRGTRAGPRSQLRVGGRSLLGERPRPVGGRAARPGSDGDRARPPGLGGAGRRRRRCHSLGPSTRCSRPAARRVIATMVATLPALSPGDSEAVDGDLGIAAGLAAAWFPIHLRRSSTRSAPHWYC